MREHHDPAASEHQQQPEQVPFELGDSPVSEQDIEKHLDALDALASPVPPQQSAAAPSPAAIPAPDGDPLPAADREPITPPPSPWPRISILWLLSLASTGLVVAVALSTLRTNPFCSKLGICSEEAIKEASLGLERAAASATRLDRELTVRSYEQSLRDLQQQVEQADRQGVFNQDQQDKLDRLRRSSDQAQRRLDQEKADQQLLLEITTAIPGLKSLTGSAAERRRQQLLKQLNQVKPASFSYAAAQSLQKQLQPAPPPPAAITARPNVWKEHPTAPRRDYSRSDDTASRGRQSPRAQAPGPAADDSNLPDLPEPLW